MVRFVAALNCCHPNRIVKNFKDDSIIADAKAVLIGAGERLGELQRVQLERIEFYLFNDALLQATGPAIELAVRSLGKSHPHTITTCRDVPLYLQARRLRPRSASWCERSSSCLGKQDNCQVAVSLSVANHHASLPVAYRLYLPQDWAKDRSRRRKAGVPKEISFKTKPEIALEQLRWACEAGLPRGVVLMDAGYGADTDVRANVTTLGLSYVAGIMPNTTVWAPGTGPLPPKKWSGQGRPPKLIRRDARHGPTSVKALALALPANAWRTIKWREGSADWLSSRFTRLRVRVAHRDYNLTESRAEEWLLIEWPRKRKSRPNIGSRPSEGTPSSLVDIAKLRWRIERDYQELKQEVGLGHFEGRGWRGFHHHATLCIAAYRFLVAEREMIPPSGHRSTTLFPEPAVPDGYQPRGSAATARASHPKLDRNHASTIDRRARQKPAPMPTLQLCNRKVVTAQKFMTQ